MDAFAAMLAVIVGWLLGQLANLMLAGRERTSRDRDQRREAYARFLAAGEACRRTVDEVLAWEDLAAGRRRGGGVQELSRLVQQISDHRRDSRLLFAEMRLLAPEEVLRAADDYHRAAEDGALLVRFGSASTEHRERWTRLEQSWEAARDAFQAAARADLGEHLLAGRRRLFRSTQD